MFLKSTQIPSAVSTAASAVSPPYFSPALTLSSHPPKSPICCYNFSIPNFFAKSPKLTYLNCCHSPAILPPPPPSRRRLLQVTSLIEKKMESIVKKYQQKFRKIKEETSRWEELQSQLISQFSNASSIIHRLQVIQNSKNYGVLRCVEGIEGAVLAKQMDSLQIIFISINNTMKEFCGIVSYLEKVVRDGKQIVKTGGSSQITAKQLKQRIGVKPTLADCLEGLRLLEEMHRSEYLLKVSVVSALPALALKPSASGDLGALQQLLVDQPNIPQEEVQYIYDIIFAEDIS